MSGALPVPDDVLQETVELVRKYGDTSKASRAANIPRTTLQRRMQMAAKRGFFGFDPVLPGFHIKQTSAQFNSEGVKEKEWVQQKPAPGEVFEVPDGHVIRGVSAYVDQDQRIIGQWIKTKTDGESVDWCEVFKGAFAEY